LAPQLDRSDGNNPSPKKQTDGTIRYTAIVRLRVGTIVQHYESKTFTHYAAASRCAQTAWSFLSVTRLASAMRRPSRLRSS
jgi:hypothetical protein